MKRAPQIAHTSITVIFFILTAIAGFSQQADSTKVKPKIGLVLSGGGAKGLAHIGVLKVLEEYGIKPDIITGTSMGSIVGGLYAVGYTVEELTEINLNANWEQLLTDDAPLQKIAMEEKTESNKYLFQIPVKDNKIILPSGLIEGQNLEEYFSELFWPLTSHENFDSLPIPFHCMSVDLVSGKAVEHKSGNLVQCIRASMSIPTLFSPVQMDSMLLVDGGVMRNFPVQEAINMGAELIIGVYVGFQEDVKAKDLSSITDILQRSIALAGIVDATAQNSKVDILIFPDLSEYGAGDFTKGPEIQQLGEDAAREKFNELSDLTLSLNLNSEETKRIERPQKILISDIEVENLQYLSKSFVVAKSGIEKGDSLSHQNIHEAIEYMYGTQYFRKLTYALKKNEEDNYVLVFHVKENPRAMIKLAPHYDNDLGVGLVTNLTLRNVIVPSSRLLATFNIAEIPGIKLELNKFIGKNQRLSNRFFLNNYNIKSRIYTDGERLGNYNRQLFDIGYGIQYSPSLNHQFRGNFFYKYGKIKPQADLRLIYPEADFDDYKTKEWGYNILYKINTTNDLYFPKNGSKLDLAFTHIFSSNADLNANPIDDGPGYFVPEDVQPFASLHLFYDWYKTVAGTVTLNFGAGAGLNTDDAGISGYYLLGSSQFGSIPNYIDFAGYNFAEIYAPNIAYVKSGINIEILSGFYFSGSVNVGNIGNSYHELATNIGDNPLKDQYWGYNAGIKYNSILGPVQLLFSDNNKDGEIRFHFSIGFPF